MGRGINTCRGGRISPEKKFDVVKSVVIKMRGNVSEIVEGQTM